MKKHEWYGMIGVAAIVLIGYLMVVESNTQESPNETSETVDDARLALRYSPEELAAIYSRNEIAADDQLKGRLISVTGTIEKVGTGLFGGPEVTLHVDIQSGNTEVLWILCKFPRSSKANLTGLSKGSAITIEGKCEGMLVSRVILGDCEFGY